MHTPEYVVKGALPYDQEWIDSATERLVGGCNQPRPKPRPAEWTTVGGKSVPVPPPPKKPLWRRLIS